MYLPCGVVVGVEVPEVVLPLGPEGGCHTRRGVTGDVTLMFASVLIPRFPKKHNITYWMNASSVIILGC